MDDCNERQCCDKESRIKPIFPDSTKMDGEALKIVKKYMLEHLDKSEEMPNFDVYIVWKCKTLQNWKYLISSTISDGMYYELTFNGDREEWYLDAYKKFENRAIAYMDV